LGLTLQVNDIGPFDLLLHHLVAGQILYLLFCLLRSKMEAGQVESAKMGPMGLVHPKEAVLVSFVVGLLCSLSSMVSAQRSLAGQVSTEVLPSFQILLSSCIHSRP
jgi:hypothetical protein